MPLKSHNDGAIFADHLAGASPPVVALHGWGRDRRDLVPLVEGYAAIVPDLPGFGSSPAPETAYTTSDYAGAVAQLIEESGVPRCVLVGHSFGGRVAARLGATRPDLVGGVLFLGVPLVRERAASRPSLKFRAARLANRYRVLSDAKIEALRQRYGSADYAAARGVMRSVLVGVVSESYEADVEALAVPVGFCWGANDTTVPSRVAEQAAAIAPHVVHFEIVEGAGHHVALEAPGASRLALDDVVEAATCA